MRTGVDGGWRVVAILGLLLGAVGCGRSDRPPLGTVTGVVTLDDKPLPGAIVYYSPAEGGRVSQAMTDEQGKYDLVYIGTTRGAKTGAHSVRITTAYETYDEKSGESVVKKELVPKRYNSTETELKVEVAPGRNEFDFPLTSEK